MRCKYCGHALSNNQATCPNCGMLMTEEQLKRRKELNGYNNPYMQRLNKINEDRIKHKLYENVQTKSIKEMLIIVAIVLCVIIIAIILTMSR